MLYIKSLDGLRGISVLMVAAFHFGYFAAGWIGVQIFFVLSGYLITTILLQNRGLPFKDFIFDFYWKRSLRILPLNYAFLLAALCSFYLLAWPPRFDADAAWLFLYVGNVARLRPDDLGPAVIHLWSLAVEWQFYLIWPIIVYFLSLSALRKVVIGILVLSPLVRFGVFYSLTAYGFDAVYAGKAAYVLPFTQFDAFAAGAAVPFWQLHRIKRAVPLFLAMLVLAAIAGFLVLLTSHLYLGGAFIGSFGYQMYMTTLGQYAWGYTIINVLSMLMIVCAIQGAALFRILNASILVWIGRISYGVYYYHLPLLVLAQSDLGINAGSLSPFARIGVFVCWILATLLVSQVSYSFLEKPFLRMKNIRPYQAKLS